MPSEFIQRQIDKLLEQASEALTRFDWETLRQSAGAILKFDPENSDAKALLTVAEESLGSAAPPSTVSPPEDTTPTQKPARTQPTSFVNGRYTVIRFLGEGGKKIVYLCKDTLLNREVAFALIKLEGLDDVGRQRILREAQDTARLGDHPNTVNVYDAGEENGQPYIVSQYMAGGDVEGLLKEAKDHKLSLERALEIAIQVCRGLAHGHAQGLIHRDIKPGNVWLTADGVAKVGDYG
ncbi:MAG: serine/threonine protein kinase, partial [Dehalococcoidia bacterium]|nr:serine/threonine protein kinase [Dehalococcoidia bacterium]